MYYYASWNVMYVSEHNMKLIGNIRRVYKTDKQLSIFSWMLSGASSCFTLSLFSVFTMCKYFFCLKK